jgi:hypothetical protein
MAAAYRSFDRRSRISFDWMLVGAAFLAGCLLAGTVIRTDAGSQSAQFGTHVGGLRALAPHERLVVFEDMSSGNAAGWSAGRREAGHVGLGAVWLADPGAPLSRTIALPEGTERAALALDLVAIDAWAGEGLEVAVNGVPVLRHGFGPAGDTRTAPEAPEGAAGITTRTRLSAPQELGFAAGSAALAEQRLTVDIAVADPGPGLSLTITPLPSAEGAARAAPAWAVDNLIVVATGRP